MYIASGSQLEVIGEGAFSECSSLGSISLPASVDEIGYFAFGGVELVIFSVKESETPDGQMWNADNLGCSAIEWAE